MIIDKTINIECATISNNILWFIVSESPYVYGADVNTLEIVFKKKIFSSYNRQSYMYFSMTVHEGKLYLFPFNAGDIVIMDITSGEVEQISIPQLYTKAHFCGISVVGHYIFSYGVYAPVIMKLNTRTKEVDYLDMSQAIKRQLGTYFSESSALIKNEELYVLLRNTTTLIKINPETLEYKMITIDGSSGMYYGLYSSGNEMVCTPEVSEYPVLYLDDRFAVKRKILMSGNADKPVGLLPNGNDVFISQDSQLKAELCQIVEGYESAIEFEDGYFVYNKERNGLKVFKNDGNDREIYPKISLELEDINGTIVNEQLISLDSFLKIIGGENEDNRC